jgi:hypothetical protein
MAVCNCHEVSDGECEMLSDRGHETCAYCPDLKEGEKNSKPLNNCKTCCNHICLEHSDYVKEYRLHFCKAGLTHYFYGKRHCLKTYAVFLYEKYVPDEDNDYEYPKKRSRNQRKRKTRPVEEEDQ